MIGNKVKIPSPNIERVKWVDAAKAMGLFLVFWGHILYGGSSSASIINRAIYSFHMPMYFILSGYVLKPELKPFNDYIRSKFKRILLPAILIYILTLPIFFSPHYLDYSSATLYTVLERILYLKGQCAYNCPIWFFFCMFQILIVIKLLDLSNASFKKIALIGIVSLVFSFGMYELRWEYFKILGFNKLVLGLFFYTFGMILRRTSYEGRSKIVGYASIVIWVLSGIIFNTKCSMYGMKLGDFCLFILSGITGSLVFFALCKFFENNKNIRTYSKWTVFIVCSHYVLVTVFSIFASLMAIKNTIVFDIASVVFVLISLYGYKYVCSFIEKRLPFLIGK